MKPFTFTVLYINSHQLIDARSANFIHPPSDVISKNTIYKLIYIPDEFKVLNIIRLMGKCHTTITMFIA